MSLTEQVFFDACLKNAYCRSMYNQGRSNMTEFTRIAGTLIPGWPRDIASVQAEIGSDQIKAAQYFLMAHAATEGCGPNQKRVGNVCTHLDLDEVPSSLFINVIFVFAIIIAVLATAYYLVKNKCGEEQEDDDDEGGGAKKDGYEAEGGDITKRGGTLGPAQGQQAARDQPGYGVPQNTGAKAVAVAAATSAPSPYPHHRLASALLSSTSLSKKGSGGGGPTR